MENKFEKAISAIIEGSKLHHLGRFLQNRKIQANGLRQTDIGMKVIDEDCPSARDVLIPLLQHEDAGVRVTIASALVLSRPDLAMPVLEEISNNCTTIAQQSARSILCYHEVFCPGLASLCRPDPRYPIPEKYHYKGPPLDL